MIDQLVTRPDPFVYFIAVFPLTLIAVGLGYLYASHYGGAQTEKAEWAFGLGQACYLWADRADSWVLVLLCVGAVRGSPYAGRQRSRRDSDRVFAGRLFARFQGSAVSQYADRIHEKAPRDVR